MKKTLQLLNPIFLVILSLVFFATKSTQAVVTSVLGDLPSQLVESSGIDFTGTSGFWTHNDGYGDNKLYQISNTGSLVRTLTVQGAVNTDWEDITHDAGRNYLFIGDFGNNANNRTNLHIYRIPYPSSVSGNTVNAQTINFSYPDQTQFPPAWTNFDMEGFVHYDGHLYLFSKSSGAAVGYTKMYMLPDVPGTYVATLVDSFYTNDRTTSAALSPDGTTLILITETRMHMFRNFPGTDFFHGQHTQISINGTITQKEAITFSSNTTIFMTDEDAGAGNFLYSADLSIYIPPSTNGINSIDSRTQFSLYPNPSRSYFIIEFKEPIEAGLMLKLFNMTGNLVRETSREYPVASLRMETADLPSGIYFYKLFAEGREVHSSRVIVSH